VSSSEATNCTFSNAQARHFNQNRRYSTSDSDNVLEQLNAKSVGDNGPMNDATYPSLRVPHVGILSSLPLPFTAVSSPVALSLTNTPSSSGITEYDPLKGQKDTIYRCEYPDCTLKVNFKRRFDLNRHIRDKHTKIVVFDCLAVGCDRVGKKTFRRKDKLSDHFWRVHGDDSLLKCPVERCDRILPFYSFALHLRRAHPASEVCKIWRRLSWRPQDRMCPLQGCQKWSNTSNDLKKHLLEEHNERDRLAQKSTVNRAGFNPTSCDFLCPLCSIHIQEWEDFGGHLTCVHLVDVAHLEAWIAEISKHSTPTLSPPRNIIPADYGRDEWKNGRFKCPVCKYSSSRGRKTYTPAHREMFINSEEIYLHREAVLRLFQSLETHPVFDDLGPV
jgi:hypothetical protein